MPLTFLPYYKKNKILKGQGKERGFMAKLKRESDKKAANKNATNKKESGWLKQHCAECIAMLFIIVFITLVLVWNQGIQDKYQHYNNTNITYEKGIVTEVKNDELTVDETDSGRYLGLQYASIKMLSGKYKGRIVETENYLTAASNIYAEPGTRVIVSQDEPEDTEPYFVIYNYYRSPAIYGILLVFGFFMLLIGGRKGMRAILGLAFTLFVIVMWMIPVIYLGYSPVMASIVTVIITTAAALVLLNGASKKTLAAICGTALGVILVGIIFALFAAVLHVSGYNTDETEFMVLISKNTHLQIAEVLFAGVLIASLGAVMDVGMSIASAIFEVQSANQQLSRRELFRSGINIGKDMIGTMSNTLILAFTGSGLSTLLVLTGYGIKYHQLVSSDFLAIEVGQGLSGTIAVILTVPITSAVASVLYKRKK